MRKFSLHEIYTEIREDVKLIPEVGEGTSKPFPYKETFRSENNFAYEIQGEVRNENGEFVLQEIPIRLQAIAFFQLIDQEDGEWTVDGYDENNEYGKFLNVSPGTTLKGYEIIFSQISYGSSRGRDTSFAEVNDRVFMYRLMATIKKILQDEFAKSKPDLLIYSPNKKGNEAVEKTGRHRLYNAFIRKALPSARVFVDDRSEEIIYKLK